MTDLPKRMWASIVSRHRERLDRAQRMAHAGVSSSWCLATAP